MQWDLLAILLLFVPYIQAQVKATAYPTGAKLSSYKSEMISYSKTVYADPKVSSAYAAAASAMKSLVVVNPSLLNDYRAEKTSGDTIGRERELYELAQTAAAVIPKEQGKVVKSVENAKASILNKYGEGAGQSARVIPIVGVLLVVGILGVVLIL